MFAVPGWAHRLYQTILSATNPVPIAAVPDIHSGGGIQNIQGGAPGEEFHLTAAEHTFVEFALLQPLRYEPATIVEELLYSNQGEIVIMVKERYAP